MRLKYIPRSSVKVRLPYIKGFGKAMCLSWPWLGKKRELGWVDGWREGGGIIFSGEKSSIQMGYMYRSYTMDFNCIDNISFFNLYGRDNGDYYIILISVYMSLV